MLAVLLLCVIPLDEPATFECEWIELNHVYDGCGNHTLSQWIFWDWTGYRKQVADWCHAGSTKSFRRGNSLLLFSHYKSRFIRVRCREITETWTQHDPEIEDREFFPEVMRRGIR
jgi:hypothetical protein